MLAQARQQHPDEADHPGAAMAARPPDQFDQRGPLHTHIGGWMEQEAAKLPEPDGVPPQADGVPIQSKRLRAGREEAKGRLDRVQRREGGTAHWQLPGAEDKAAAIQANPAHRQPERQRQGASQVLLTMFDAGSVVRLVDATSHLWITEGCVLDSA
jgi:hypothetical protein